MNTRFFQVLCLGLTFFLPGWLSAGEPPVLKALLVIQDDYTDAELNAIASGVKMDYGLVSQFLDTLDKAGVMKVEKTLLRGRTATKANTLQLVNNYKLGSDDVFLVYFSGHGGMEKGKTFLYMADETALFRDELQAAVKSRPARLKMIFTDACSSSIEAMAARGKIGSGNKDEKGNPFTEIYRGLFLNYRGTLDFSAASEGEYAWSADTGGLFTKSLFSELLNQDPRPTWEELLKETRAKVADKFNLMVNAGLLDKASVEDMKDKGIKGQTPKAYSLPEAIKATVTQTGKPEVKPETKPETSKTQAGVTPVAEGQAVIQNLTKTAQTIFVAGNLSGKGQVIKLDPKAKKSLPLGKGLYLWIGDKARGDYWELENEAYLLSLNYLGEPELFFDEPAARAGTENPLLGTWLWEEEDPDSDQVITIDMEVRADGSFVWTNPDKPDFLVKGTWTLAGSKENRTITLKYKYGKNNVTETYTTEDFGQDSMVLISKDDEALEISLTRN